MRKVNTTRFGEIEVEDEDVLKFPQGIPAFEDEHEFRMIPYPPGEDTPYAFLQSLTTPSLAFLMADPFRFFFDYSFEIDDESLETLGSPKQDDIAIYTILTLPDGKVEDMTANLMAPVVINSHTMTAKQVVLERSRYQTKHRLFPAKDEESKSDE